MMKGGSFDHASHALQSLSDNYYNYVPGLLLVLLQRHLIYGSRLTSLNTYIGSEGNKVMFTLSTTILHVSVLTYNVMCIHCVCVCVSL